MTIKDVLFFDTETTGIPDRNAHWETDYADFPHIVQIAWINAHGMESHIIRPNGWEIPEETIAIHGITMERAMAEGEPFADVMALFIDDCLESPLICGHNIHFDTSIVKANILREMGHEWYESNMVESALFKGKRLDTMRPAMKWVDARRPNGAIKFPNLGELYARCFPGETFPAHDALEDTKAVARCLPVLLDLGLLELKVKEYSEQASGPVAAVAKTAEIAADAAKVAAEIATAQEMAILSPVTAAKTKDDKLHVQDVQGPEIENSAKITGIVADLLNQNDF